MAGGLAIGAFLIVVSNFVPKGPYLLYAGLLTMATAIIWRKRRSSAGSDESWPLTVIFFAMLPATANVAGHWGGVEALPGALLSLSILSLPLAAAFVMKRPLWPAGIAEHARLVAAGAATAGVVAAVLGGAYIGDRFSTTEKDLHGRLRHWEQSLSMLQSPGDILFGKGLGRFPANYFFAAPDSAFPGTYRITNEDGNGLLSLTGGNYSISFGDILRVTQRIDRGFVGPFDVRLRVRAKTDAGIYLEVCDRHLIYPENCIIQQRHYQGRAGFVAAGRAQDGGRVFQAGTRPSGPSRSACSPSAGRSRSMTSNFRRWPMATCCRTVILLRAATAGS